MQRFSLVTIRKRIAILFLGFVCACSLLGLRLLYLQVIRGDRYMGLALDQRLSPVPLLPYRGTILDRNRQPLAVSVSAEAAYAIPVEVTEPQQVAGQLASLLDLEEDFVLRQLQRRMRTVWLKRQLTPEEARAVREARLPGIYVIEGPQRLYPHDRLAAHVIGFAGIDNQGLEGLEVRYDAYLKGQEGMILRERDAGGRAIPGGIERRIPPQDGDDVVLTIDQAIQHIVERELERAVLESQSEFGLFIGVDPMTGEVLASAVYPSFDLNRWMDYSPNRWRNRTVTDQFEPGSTFKVITGATALEVGAAQIDSEFIDPVTVTKYGQRLSCWRPGGHGHQTFIEATENSCNPIFAILAADEIGPDRFRASIEAFGFGKPTGIDYPGEAAGLIPPANAQLLRWANVGFGQGIAVTPIQLAMAVSAIANGGTLYVPHLVSEIVDAEGNVVRRFEPEPVRRVLTDETADEFAFTMRSVVVNGSGTRSDVPGYRVAGKTGTAQIPGPGGYIDLNMASFVGFAPVDDPRIAGVIMLYKIGVQPSWGGLWAAPPFGRIVEQVLDYLGVRRVFDEADEAQAGMVAVPNVRNSAREAAAHTLATAGLRYAFQGTGEFVMDQVPTPGATVERGTTVIISFYQEDRSQAQKQVEVPSLRGRNMRDAALLLQEEGLRIRIEGSGIAVDQDPQPGRWVPGGSTVTVEFLPIEGP